MKMHIIIKMHKFFINFSFIKFTSIIIVIVLSIIGVKLIIGSHAQTSSVAINPNISTITPPATSTTDNSAPGGKSVLFSSTNNSSFSISGTKILRNNTQFVPYGFVLPCPISENTPGDITSVCSDNGGTENSGITTIDAAAKYWNANYVRLQVAQGLLFSGSVQDSCGTVNSGYVNVIDGLVNEANKNGMVATITLQEETGDNGNYALPTAPTSSAFWKYMACHYKNNSAVFFSLYNEPSLDPSAISSGTWKDVWKIWQSGGTALQEGKNGVIDTTKNMTYLGMQNLIDIIRGLGSNNIIIAEGPNHDKDLSGLDPTAYGGQTFALTGSNIAYGFEPNEHGDSTTGNPSQAFTNFGQYFSKGYIIIPEAYLNYYAAQSCDVNSPVDVPLKLNYIKSLNGNGMGLVFWEMNGGIAIKGNGTNKPDLSQPTVYSNSTMTCNVGAADTLSNTQGYGQDVMNWYKQNSVRF